MSSMSDSKSVFFICGFAVVVILVFIFPSYESLIFSIHVQSSPFEWIGLNLILRGTRLCVNLVKEWVHFKEYLLETDLKG